LHFAFICGPDRFQVLSPRFAGSHKISGSPSESRSSQLDCQYVGNETGMPAITIWKRMNHYEPVMEANSDFIW
jgi:hypothetical protein